MQSNIDTTTTTTDRARDAAEREGQAPEARPDFPIRDTHDVIIASALQIMIWRLQNAREEFDELFATVMGATDELMNMCSDPAVTRAAERSQASACRAYGKGRHDISSVLVKLGDIMAHAGAPAEGAEGAARRVVVAELAAVTTEGQVRQ